MEQILKGNCIGLLETHGELPLEKKGSLDLRENCPLFVELIEHLNMEVFVKECPKMNKWFVECVGFCRIHHILLELEMLTDNDLIYMIL